MQPQAPRRRNDVRTNSVALGRKHRPDYLILILSILLLAIGVIVVYAISPALSAANHVSSNFYVGKQLLAIALSAVAFLITSQVQIGRAHV